MSRGATPRSILELRAVPDVSVLRVDLASEDSDVRRRRDEHRRGRHDTPENDVGRTRLDVPPVGRDAADLDVRAEDVQIRKPGNALPRNDHPPSGGFRAARDGPGPDTSPGLTTTTTPAGAAENARATLPQGAARLQDPESFPPTAT